MGGPYFLAGDFDYFLLDLLKVANSQIPVVSGLDGCNGGKEINQGPEYLNVGQIHGEVFVRSGHIRFDDHGFRDLGKTFVHGDEIRDEGMFEKLSKATGLKILIKGKVVGPHKWGIRQCESKDGTFQAEFDCELFERMSGVGLDDLEEGIEAFEEMMP